MTDPLNSPRSLRIGETTSRMLQREPSLFRQHGAVVVLDALPERRRRSPPRRSCRRFPRRRAHRPRRGKRPSPRADETPVSFSATGFMKVMQVAASVQITASPIEFKVTRSRSFSSASCAAASVRRSSACLQAGDVGQCVPIARIALPVGVALEHLAAVEHPDPVAILVAHAELGFEERHLAADMRAVGRGDGLAVVRMDQRQPQIRIAVELVLAIAQHLLPDRRIVAGAALAHVEVPQRPGRRSPAQSSSASRPRRCAASDCLRASMSSICETR